MLSINITFAVDDSRLLYKIVDDCSMGFVAFTALAVGLAFLLVLRFCAFSVKVETNKNNQIAMNVLYLVICFFLYLSYKDKKFIPCNETLWWFL